MKRSKHKNKSILGKHSRSSAKEKQISTSAAELHQNILEFDRGTPDTLTELVRESLDEGERTS